MQSTDGKGDVMERSEPSNWHDGLAVAHVQSYLLASPGLRDIQGLELLEELCRKVFDETRQASGLGEAARPLAPHVSRALSHRRRKTSRTPGRRRCMARADEAEDRKRLAQLDGPSPHVQFTRRGPKHERTPFEGELRLDGRTSVQLLHFGEESWRLTWLRRADDLRGCGTRRGSLAAGTVRELRLGYEVDSRLADDVSASPCCVPSQPDSPASRSRNDESPCLTTVPSDLIHVGLTLAAEPYSLHKILTTGGRIADEAVSRPVIFISHAGSETSEAQNLARRLEAANIPTILDRFQLRPGDDFVAFMDEALTRSDYCLLLWSRTAASRSYVQAEYRAAFARESVQRRIFVLVARLHDHPPPPLLRSRICVDLFPNFAEGAQKLIDFWQGDYSVAERLGKPVVPTPFPPEECELTGQDSSSTLPTSTAQAVPVVNDVREVYVTSELFDCTLPLFVNLAQPAGVLLERVRHRLDLPREIGVRSSIGLRLSLALLYRTNVLEKTSSLRAQGITGGSVVTLELTVTPFAEAEPVRTESGRQVFRSGTELNDLLLKLLLQRGLKAS